MTTTAAPASGDTGATPTGRDRGRPRKRRGVDMSSPRRLSRGQAVLQGSVLTIGAGAFLFPF